MGHGNVRLQIGFCDSTMILPLPPVPEGPGEGVAAAAAAAHTWLTLTKRFTNLKVNLKCLGLYTGAKMQRVSYEFE